MGSLSSYLENAILDHLFQQGNSDYPSPTIYVALSRANPGEDGFGMDEPSTGAYARVATVYTDWDNAADGIVDNLSAITFPEATLAWGTITHFALFDAATGGNMLAYGELPAPKVVVAEDIPDFAIGALTITAD
jgi:hypothetical protein